MNIGMKGIFVFIFLVKGIINNKYESARRRRYGGGGKIRPFSDHVGYGT